MFSLHTYRKPFRKNTSPKSDSEIEQANLRSKLRSQRARLANVKSKVKRRETDPRRKLLAAARVGTCTRNLPPMTITLEDIPTPFHCPYLGLRLWYGGNKRGEVADNTATIDRIDSTRGYEKGNIQVISMLANRMKNNAAIKELVIFAKNVLRIHGENP